jgi:uncharacterized membrane protein YjdF
MVLTKQEKLITWVNGIIIATLSVYFLATKNYEFIFYVSIVIAVYILMVFMTRHFKFSTSLLLGMSVWAWLHMAGGAIPIGDGVLYSLELVPIVGTGDSFILKYDQVVHMFGIFMTTIMAKHLLARFFTQKVNWAVAYASLVLIGMGFGAINETIEFIAVVVIPETGVGGYENTMIDIIFNALGAVAAVIVIHLRRTSTQ